jgi:branched-chain amino acid transport system ATP-binding protein
VSEEIAVTERTGETILGLEGVTKRFLGLVAVDNVSFDVKRGEVFALIGPNGAGKTTLFNCITGMFPPSNGRVTFAGHDITGSKPHRVAHLGIARTFQNIRVFGAMTVLENVLTGMQVQLRSSAFAVVARLPSFRREEKAAVVRARAALEFVGLSARAEDRAAALAYGDQRRLEIARALAPSPRLLLLDEPAAGMNPAETATLAGLVRGIAAAGTTVLLVEHDMGFVMGLSDSVTVLNFGRLICHGTPEAVRQERTVIEAYLGQKVADRLAARAAP